MTMSAPVGIDQNSNTGAAETESPRVLADGLDSGDPGGGRRKIQGDRFLLQVSADSVFADVHCNLRCQVPKVALRRQDHVFAWWDGERIGAFCRRTRRRRILQLPPVPTRCPVQPLVLPLAWEHLWGALTGAAGAEAAATGAAAGADSEAVSNGGLSTSQFT